ncbi:MAG: hypothetical protein L6290_03835 [Thermodesulfovibrionales bacterium]|nr:hypothetical protein [Thermodesulfovibrionales bacterium]
MIKVITLCLIFLVLSSAEGAPQNPKSFAHLSRLDAGESKGVIFIYYNAKISKILKHKVESSDHPGTALRAIETKIDSTSRDKHIIDYDAGPSGDPHFVVYKKEDNKLTQVGSFLGTELIIPGDGTVYVSGEADDFFNKRRKYVLRDVRLEEIVQPYYYVGLKTTNTKPMDMYTDRSFKSKVAHLPPNSEIEVLLATKKNEYEYDYLIKSPYGLVGWSIVESQYGLCGTEIIKGICFHGD